MDFATGESYNFDEPLSDDVRPPKPPAVVVLVPNELKRSPNDDIKSPLRLPNPMSPRPDDAVGLKRDELVVVAVEVAFVDEE